MTKFILGKDGSFIAKESKETSVELEGPIPINLEDFIKYLPFWTEQLNMFKKSSGINIVIDKPRSYTYRMSFWSAIREENKDVFTQEEINNIAQWGHEGNILIAKLDLIKREIHYIKFKFYNEKKEQEEIYFAESRSHKGLFYLIRYNGTKYICGCKSYRFRNWCAHTTNLK